MWRRYELVAKRQRLLLLALGVMTLSTARSARAQTANGCTDLPNPVLKLIQTKFPGWRPRQLSDLASDDQQLWVKAHGNQCPGTAVGHFESPYRPSYAALIVRQSDTCGPYKLLTFSKSGTGDGYVWKLVDHWNAKDYHCVVISTIPPGQYSDYEDARISVTTKLDCRSADVEEDARTRKPQSFQRPNYGEGEDKSSV